MPAPIVFISYSHDSDDHRERVCALSGRLREGGVDTILDQYVNGTPDEQWPRWMLNGIDAATHVLCICTPTYYRRFRGQENPGKGKGVDWEGAIITQELYDARSKSTKFIPVLFSDGRDSDVPEPLRGATYYLLEQNYDALYDAILGQGAQHIPPLGPSRTKAPENSDADDSTSTGDESVDPPTKRKPTPDELSKVHEETISEIEVTLNSAPTLAKFLGAESLGKGRFALQQGTQWVVDSAYRSGVVDVTPVLTGIWRRRLDFEAPDHEWEALNLVTGGALVLGISPEWIWTQRLVCKTSPVKHPKRADLVDTEDGRAKFLAVLATALARGCARLERVFGPLDQKLVPDMADVGPGITATDHSAEIKRHFVRYVIGPSDEFTVDALDSDALQTKFDRVRQLLYIADEIDRDPFYAAGGNLKELAAEVSQHLELADLYLFVPSGRGDESQVMINPVIALTFAQRIWKFVKTHRPQI